MTFLNKKNLKVSTSLKLLSDFPGWGQPSKPVLQPAAVQIDEIKKSESVYISSFQINIVIRYK